MFCLTAFYHLKSNCQYGFKLNRLGYLTMSCQGITVIRHMEVLTSTKDWVINLIIRVMQTGSPDSKNTGMTVSFMHRFLCVFSLIKGCFNLVYFYVCFCFFYYDKTIGHVLGILTRSVLNRQASFFFFDRNRAEI